MSNEQENFSNIFTNTLIGDQPDNDSSEIIELKKVAPVKIARNDIQRDPVFESLFPIDPSIKASIVKDMKENGYDANFPLILWNREDGKKILIDGHTRDESAEEAGLEFVYAKYQSFENETDAKRYADKLQLNRRNLDDAGKLKYVIERGLDYIKEQQAGSEKKLVASLLNIGETKARAIIAIVKRAPKNTISDVLSGKISINKAYTSLDGVSDSNKNKVSLKKNQKIVDSVSSHESKEDSGIDSLIVEDPQDDLPIIDDYNNDIVDEIPSNNDKTEDSISDIDELKHIGRPLNPYQFINNVIYHLKSPNVDPNDIFTILEQACSDFSFITEDEKQKLYKYI